jgi:ribosomal protein S18 acetylase RimI-like enzyme
MAVAVRVLAGVAVGRVIAAAGLPALEADAQVQPLAAGGEAFRASLDRLGQLGDLDVIEVRAGGHRQPPFYHLASMSEHVVRPIPLERTRALRQAVLRPHEAVERMTSSETADTFALGAFAGDELVAVGMIAPDGEPGGWRIRGMATAPRARGAGAGTAVLDGLLEHALAAGARRIWCNARTPARSLYERADMCVVSEEFELPEIGPHVVMEMRTRR